MDKNCPFYARAYERSNVLFDALVPGTMLLMLRAGFGGLGGEVRVVESSILGEIGKRHLILVEPGARSDDDHTYLLREDDDRTGPWYLSAIIISEEYRSLNRRDRQAWQIKHIGKLL
jgi:hypothetical protein